MYEEKEAELDRQDDLEALEGQHNSSGSLYILTIAGPVLPE